MPRLWTGIPMRSRLSPYLRERQVPTYDLETIDALPPKQRGWAPPLAQRQAMRPGDQVRLLVIVNGRTAEYPWVAVIGALEGGQYSGKSVASYGRTEDYIPEGTW